MKPDIFGELWLDALRVEDRDAYVSDWTMSSVWGDTPDDDIILRRAVDCGKIWDAAHRSMRDIVAESGLTQAGFARRFCIPLRTVESWCCGRRAPADYDRLMIQQLLGLL